MIDDNSLVIGLFSRAGVHYEAQVMDEYTRHHKATTVVIAHALGVSKGLNPDRPRFHASFVEIERF